MARVDGDQQALSDGFWRWAKKYLITAQILWRKVKEDCDGALPDPHPAYYPTQLLTCHAIELSLKAFLSAKGEPAESLKKEMGHDLIKLFNRAFESGLSDIFNAPEAFQDAVQLISFQYFEQDFKYFDLDKVSIDNDIECLLDNTKLLVDAMRPVCVAEV